LLSPVRTRTTTWHEPCVTVCHALFEFGGWGKRACTSCKHSRASRRYSSARLSKKPRPPAEYAITASRNVALRKSFQRRVLNIAAGSPLSPIDYLGRERPQ